MRYRVSTTGVTEMTEDERKAAIRRRLVLAKYPRRSQAQFTDENGHNPTVLQACPRCHGRGLVCEDSSGGTRRVLTRDKCAECGGSGVTGEVEPYFTNDNPEAEAVVKGEGITCPNCGWRFRISDRHAWTGRRHLRCGQRIRLVQDTQPPSR